MTPDIWYTNLARVRKKLAVNYVIFSSSLKLSLCKRIFSSSLATTVMCIQSVKCDLNFPRDGPISSSSVYPDY